MDIPPTHQLIIGKLSRWLHELIRMIPNLLLASILLVLGLFLARAVKRMSGRLMKNVTHNATTNGLDLSIGVSYGDDLRKVKTVTMEAVKGLPFLSDEDETTMFYREFGDSSINFVIRLWVKSPEQKAFLEACSEAIVRIKEAYDKNNILIPFPIRTLDFGIKGGSTLKEMLSNGTR